MWKQFWDWALGVKRKEEPYRYRRHRAWEERELAPADYIPPSLSRLDRVMAMPETYRAYVTGRLRPIVQHEFGAGSSAEQVWRWAAQRQRLFELRFRAALRKEARRTWAWLEWSPSEVRELWPVRVPASV